MYQKLGKEEKREEEEEEETRKKIYIITSRFLRQSTEILKSTVKFLGTMPSRLAIKTTQNRKYKCFSDSNNWKKSGT